MAPATGEQILGIEAPQSRDARVVAFTLRRPNNLIKWLAACLLASTALVPLAALAAPPTVTWTGGGADNDWGSGANWDNFAAPTASDNAVLPGSTPRQPALIAGSRTVDTLTMNGTGNTLSLNANTL